MRRMVCLLLIAGLAALVSAGCGRGKGGPETKAPAKQAEKAGQSGTKPKKRLEAAPKPKAPVGVKPKTEPKDPTKRVLAWKSLFDNKDQFETQVKSKRIAPRGFDVKHTPAGLSLTANDEANALLLRGVNLDAKKNPAIRVGVIGCEKARMLWARKSDVEKGGYPFRKGRMVEGVSRGGLIQFDAVKAKTWNETVDLIRIEFNIKPGEEIILKSIERLKG